MMAEKPIVVEYFVTTAKSTTLLCISRDCKNANAALYFHPLLGNFLMFLKKLLVFKKALKHIDLELRSNPQISNNTFWGAVTPDPNMVLDQFAIFLKYCL